ncbi:MAG: hypothetical protein ACPIOQ_13180 [Promethearchaeia archaeon]
MCTTGSSCGQIGLRASICNAALVGLVLPGRAARAVVLTLVWLWLEQVDGRSC